MKGIKIKKGTNDRVDLEFKSSIGKSILSYNGTELLLNDESIVTGTPVIEDSYTGHLNGGDSYISFTDFNVLNTVLTSFDVSTDITFNYADIYNIFRTEDALPRVHYLIGSSSTYGFYIGISNINFIGTDVYVKFNIDGFFPGSVAYSAVSTASYFLNPNIPINIRFTLESGIFKLYVNSVVATSVAQTAAIDSQIDLSFGSEDGAGTNPCAFEVANISISSNGTSLYNIINVYEDTNGDIINTVTGTTLADYSIGKYKVV